MLQNEYLDAKIGVGTAENEPLKVTDSAGGETTESVVNRLLKADLLHEIRKSGVHFEHCKETAQSLSVPERRNTAAMQLAVFIHALEMSSSR